MSICIGKFSRNLYLASLLYDSIEDNNLCAVNQIIEKGANPNTVLPNKGISPFHLAVGCEGDFALKVVELILKCGGNPNVPSLEGLTPVHIAVAWGNLAVLKLLLCYGGDPEAKDDSNMTPVKYAYKENLTECLELMKPFISNKYCDNIDLNNGFLEETKHMLAVSGKTLDEYKCGRVLKELPETDSNEYVMNWVDKHVDTPKDDAIEFISFESSLDESDNETVNKSHLLSNPVFRKHYKKTRIINRPLNKTKTSSETDSAQNVKSPTSQNVNLEFQNNLYPRSSLSSCTSPDQTSSESGIIIPIKNGQQTISLTSSEELVPNSNDIGQAEVSSDYMTASNGMPDSVFELTNELSFDLSHNTSISADKDIAALQNSSIIAFSEIYKYEDEDKGIILYERRLVKTPSLCTESESSRLSSVPDSFIYDTDTLRKELTTYSFEPGPITKTTKKLYLKKLFHLKRHPPSKNKNLQTVVKKMYSNELEKTLENPENWFNAELVFSKTLEEEVLNDFSNPDPSKKWRGGVNKSSFTYLLLDPRITKNLPWRSENLDKKKIWETFLEAIFYVGKGKRSRPYSHLYDAVLLWKQKVYTTPNKKLQYILDIWKAGGGVICLHVFHNIIPSEAYTREAAMISALKLDNITNIRVGDFYGPATRWPQSYKKKYGVFLLYKAMLIFLNDGERQIYPTDID